MQSSPSRPYVYPIIICSSSHSSSVSHSLFLNTPEVTQTSGSHGSGWSSTSLFSRSPFKACSNSIDRCDPSRSNAICDASSIDLTKRSGSEDMDGGFYSVPFSICGCRHCSDGNLPRWRSSRLQILKLLRRSTNRRRSHRRSGDIISPMSFHPIIIIIMHHVLFLT